MDDLPRRRTPGEVVAYLDGFDAAVRLFEERLPRYVDGDRSAIRAVVAEIRTMGELNRKALA